MSFVGAHHGREDWQQHTTAAAPPVDLAATLKMSAIYSSYSLRWRETLVFANLHGPKTGPAEPNFFFAQHVVQFKGTTKFDVIVADAKLVGSASDPAERLTQSP